MPAVIDDTDVLEHTTSSPDYTTAHTLPLVLPASRRRPSQFIASLRGLCTLLRRLRPHQIQPCVPEMPQCELSMDIMAWKYPKIYRRITSWSI
jgi:hypothetical protein